jgi:RNA polymerase sigma factor (sigma-70 family)
VAPETATAEDVRSYLNANLRRLRLYVEREISFREDSGDLERESLSWEEVVDEAVARALDERVEKPDRIGLEPWLYRLAIRALDDFKARQKGDGVDQNADRGRQASTDAQLDEARLQFYQPDEAVTAESGIADIRLSNPEQIAYTEEMIGLIQLALRNASRTDREAFILFAIEGFSLHEIASILDRTPDEVRKSIHNAREAVRRTLPVENQLKEKLLQQTASD